MTRTADVDDIKVMRFDDAVEVDIDEIEPGRRAPVSEQTRLDMLRFSMTPAAGDCRAGRSVRPRGNWRRANRRRDETIPAR